MGIVTIEESELDSQDTLEINGVSFGSLRVIELNTRSSRKIALLTCCVCGCAVKADLQSTTASRDLHKHADWHNEQRKLIERLSMLACIG